MKNFEDLCRDNYGRIYKYIFAMTGDRESSEDLIQDVFTVAFEKGSGFMTHENPPAFLYRTARNLTLTYLKHRRQAPGELDESLAGGEGDLCDRLARDLDRRIDETAYAGAVIGGLDGAQRALYTRRYVDGAPIRELACDAGISEPAMRMRLMRLREEIRRQVGALGLGEF